MNSSSNLAGIGSGGGGGVGPTSVQSFRSISASSTGSFLLINNGQGKGGFLPLAPLQSMMQFSMNRQGNAEEHLYYQCLKLKQKLAKIPELAPFLSLAFNQAENCAEQQALALSQQLLSEGNSGLGSISEQNDGDLRASVGSSGFLIHLDHLSTLNSAGLSRNLGTQATTIFTFTAGVLPATLSADPVTQMWKLFQQGAPLCALFNSVYTQKDCHLQVVPSDDLRICKKSVYDFLIAVKTYLKFDDENLFTILNVFLDSTHDLIKIVNLINRVLPEEGGGDIEDNVGEILISDERSKVLKEMIETERKYVQDLELLSQYKDELSNAELISSEQIHILFPNINEILDFQRRFLIGLECNNNVPNRYQRIGSIFIHAAKGSFSAYEPWTIGQLSAIDLITKEAANLKKSSSLLDPGFELQSYIIKPIQRLCKYPLLLKELIKHLSQLENSALYNELLMAQRRMKQVANQVNEAQRRAENVGNLQSLQERVANWRGFNVKDQGELLFHGPVSVRDVDVEKEYFAYLFEKIIFFFMEPLATEKVKEKKKNLLQTRKKSTSSSLQVTGLTVNLLETLSKARDKTPLELKGRVYILEIYNITTMNQLGYTLVISWLGKKESGSFSLKYRNEESRNQWETCLRNLKAIEMNSQIHRKLRDLSSESAADFDVSTITSGATTINNNHQISSGGRSNRNSQYGTANSDKHSSSSSNFSMMKFGKRLESSRQSSSGTMGTLSDKISNLFTLNDLSFSSSISSGSIGAQISIKIIYRKTEINDLVVSSGIQFAELRLKISIKISSQTSEDIMINKLKYKDEDNDFVVMDSNDDWTLAVDMLDEMNAERVLTIWVS